MKNTTLYLLTPKRIRSLLCTLIGYIVFRTTLLTHSPWISHTRIRQDTGYRNRLVRRKLGCMSAEALHRSLLNAEYSLSGLRYVEIDLHNPLLAPEHFNKNCVICFKALSPERSSTECETILGHLLRYCTAPTDFLSLFTMFLTHPPQPQPHKP